MSRADDRPKRTLEVEVRRTADGMFIALGTEHRELSDVAATIWRLCSGRRSAGEIIAAVCSEYDVEQELATGDTLAFLEEMAAGGFIEWIAAAPTQITT
jgi:hypothetical protein